MDVLLTKKGKIIGIAASVFLSEFAWILYKQYKKHRKNGTNQMEIFTKILFFSEEAVLCRAHLSKKQFICRRNDCPVVYMNMILDYIKSATTTLDVCVYFLTYRDLAEAVIYAFKKNVIVRIITDCDMSRENCEEVFRLKKAGIKLRTKKSDFLMHHKFAIVDKKLLITGSTNWTLGAFFGNFENIIISNQHNFVNPFVNEFERLWNIFDV